MNGTKVSSVARPFNVGRRKAAVLPEPVWLETNKSLEFEIKENRQVYFVQIEGRSNINEITLNAGEAMEIVDIKKIEIKALENSHFLFIEMAKV